MQRLQSIDPATATGPSGELLAQAQKKMGRVPNILRAMASSPAALGVYMGASAALAGGSLNAGLREQIALLSAEKNDCDYCLAAHTAIGRSVGLGDDQIADGRRGSSPDSKHDAALRFADALLEKRGFVSDDDLAAVRRAGYGDGAIAEVVALVAINMFTNYFNHVAQTEIDFPTALTSERA